MRTFLCIPIEDHLQQAISEYSNKVSSIVSVRSSWVKEGNFHFTLRFLGEIDPMFALELKEMCGCVAREVAPFDLVIDRLGAFPSADRPRVLWVGGNAPWAFRELVAHLNCELEASGFRRERKPSVSHVTLARIKGRPDASIKNVLDSPDLSPRWTIPANRLALMESRLTSRGPLYYPLFTVRFGADEKGGNCDSSGEKDNAL